MQAFLGTKGKSIAVVLGLGVAIGAVTMAVIQDGKIFPRAQAQNPATVRTVGTANEESLATLRSLDDAFASITDFAMKSVVHIRSENGRGTDGSGRFVGPAGGEGSGAIYRPDGYIITNDHVVADFEKVTVTLSDGRSFQGKVIRDEDVDIAVVKIEAKDLPAIALADSGKVRAGQFAIAMGSPFGLENSVTIGHISALNRESQVPDPRMKAGVRYYSDLIQTDASINMGNSGGPLINVDGQIIGINSAIFSHTGDSVGIGFAIPSNQAKLIADTLIEKGKIVRGYLGIDPDNLKPYQKKEKGLEGGALVAPIPNDQSSPARDAGLKEGDVIVRVGSMPIQNQQDLRNSMLRYAPGESVEVEYVREGQKKTAKVKLTERPRPQQPASRSRVQPNAPDESNPDLQDLRRWRDRIFGGGGSEDNVAPLREGQARLGVGVDSLTPTNRKQFKVPADVQGAVVTSVEPGSVAQRLGLEVGDVIQRIGSTTIGSGKDVADAMKDVKWGERRTIKFARYGQGSMMSQDLSVTFR